MTAECFSFQSNAIVNTSIRTPWRDKLVSELHSTHCHGEDIAELFLLLTHWDCPSRTEGKESRGEKKKKYVIISLKTDSSIFKSRIQLFITTFCHLQKSY